MQSRKKVSIKQGTREFIGKCTRFYVKNERDKSFRRGKLEKLVYFTEQIE